MAERLMRRDGTRTAAWACMVDYGTSKQLLSYPDGSIRVSAPTWDEAWERFLRQCEAVPGVAYVMQNGTA